MNSFFQDLRFGVRMLAKTPGFTTVAVLVLALAIGGTSAMFTIINALMFRPPAAKNPEQLVRVYGKETKPNGGYRSFSYPNYVELCHKNTVFSDLSSFTIAMVGLNEGDLTRRSFAAIIPANYFELFGVHLPAGRAFLPEEEKPGSAVAVVIVSHSYWKRTGLDPQLIGKKIRINTRLFQVVGIAPEHFTGTTAVFSPEIWLPLGMYELLPMDIMSPTRQRLEDRKNHCLMVVGRLKPGSTMPGAQAQLQILANQMEQAHPDVNQGYTLELGGLSRLSISTNPTSDPNSAVMTTLLMGMSGAVLLIACLNLANMLLARGAARGREIAIRLSLGASRGRLVRQMLTEGFLLSLVGGGAGLLLASWATSLLMASFAPKLPFMSIVFDPRPDWRIMTTTFGFCALSTLLFGLGPAWKLTKANVTSRLKEQAGDELHGQNRGGLFSLRSLLVVGQLALSLALLTAAGLFTHAAMQAVRANPGFSLDSGLLVETDANLAGYDEARAKRAYLDLLDRLRTLPGVQFASFAYQVPFGVFHDSRAVQKASAPDAPKSGSAKDSPEGDKPIDAGFNIIATDYFKTLGLPLLRGRDFDSLELVSTSSTHVAIIDEPLARKLWPTENPVGRQIKFAGDKAFPMEVVGVVPGLRDSLDDKVPVPHVYVPFGQDYRSGMNLHVRTAAANPDAQAAMLRNLRETIRSVDPLLPVISVQTLRNFHQESLFLWFKKVAARMCGAFGALALFLAVVGVYGVKAYVVARRTREIGIRMALGADSRNVLWLVLREGLSLTAVGLGAGLILAVAVGFLVRSMIYEVQALDPVTFILAPLCLAAATLIACYLPARRATKVQPMAALRYE